MENVAAQAEIDKLIAGFFAAFDNRNGLRPSTATILGFFADKAVIGRAAGSDVVLYTAIEFALPRVELLTDGSLVSFHEAETSCRTNIFGSMAVRTSRYHKGGLLNGNPYGGMGTKTFQLVALESGWRILSLAWIDDDTAIGSDDSQSHLQPPPPINPLP